MKEKKRAIRRHNDRRAKKKAKRILKQWGSSNLTDRHIGVMASTHNVMCSCEMCGNQRHKGMNRPTMQERRMEEIPKFDISKCSNCQENPAEPEHTCPFGEDVHGDFESTCNCCEDCT